MQHPPIKTITYKLEKNIKVETMVLAPNIEVSRTTTTSFCEAKEPEVETTEEVRYRGKPTKHFGHFYVVDPALLESCRMEGWMNNPKCADWIIQKTPFTYILEGNPYAVVRLRTWDHSIFDSEGKYLPVGLHFNDINGRINDANFDLSLLREHLKSREDVTIIAPEYAYDGELLHTTPWYNRGDSCGHHYISFIWHPDKDLYQQYQDLKEDSCNSWERFNVAHTLMGNDKFRLNENPYKEGVDPDEEEEEEEVNRHLYWK